MEFFLFLAQADDITSQVVKNLAVGGPLAAALVAALLYQTKKVEKLEDKNEALRTHYEAREDARNEKIYKLLSTIGGDTDGDGKPDRS